MAAWRSRADRTAVAAPADIVADFHHLVQVARDRGFTLDPTPVVEIAANSRQSSCVLAGSPDHPAARVRLSTDLLSAPTEVRAWTMAHELGHVLRGQQRARPQRPAALLTAAAVCTVVAIGAVLAAGAAIAIKRDPAAGWVPLAAAIVGVLGLWLVLLAFIRREEAAVDAAAASVFGQVLTAVGVARLGRQEGRGSQWVPTVLRSHPRPARRARPAVVAPAAVAQG